MHKPQRASGAMATGGRLLGGIAGLAAGLAMPAHADPLTISGANTTPVTTAAAANGSAGDVTVASGGSLIVTTTDPAVTINSSNALTNSGTIQSSAASGATAVLIDGTSPITTSYTNNSVIGVTGTGGSGNYGLRIANGPVSGTIISSTASDIAVAGTNSFGVSIESAFTGDIGLNSVSVSDAGSTAISLTAPLTGSLRLTGANAATAAGGYALLVAGDISGALVNGGSLIDGASSTTLTASDGTTSTGPAVGGPAVVAIQGNVGGGFLNDRYYLDSTGAVVATASATSSDTLVTGAIQGYAGSTGVLITPSSVAEDITLSPVGTAGTVDGYGFVNRGTIVTAGSNSGVTATAVHILGADIGGTTYGVTVANGLINQSTGSIAATSIDAMATAIDIGPAANVAALVNAGAMSSAVSTSATSSGGSAYGIRIEQGAEVSSITNSGTIAVVSAGVTNTATAIADLSGTVDSVTNSGTITTSGTSGATLRAIDLSSGSAAQTVTNSGKIGGDVVFGSGGGSYISNSGTLSGSLAFGGGSNLIQLGGASVFENAISLASGGTLDVVVGGTSTFSASGTAPTLSSLSVADQSQLILGVTGTAPALAVSGAASFTGQSTIKLVISHALGEDPITVLTAAGGVTSDHAATLLSGTSAPFLYTLTGYSLDGNALTVTLHQKSASEVGFDPRIAPLFDQSLVAFGSGASFQAVANLPDQASLFSAYRQITPPSYGSYPVRLAQNLQSAGSGAIGARLDAMVDLPSDVPQGARFGPWVQQSANFLRHDDSQDDPGFRANSYDIAFGGDYALTKSLVVGMGFTFEWNDMHIDGMTAQDQTPFTVNSQMADIYAGWHKGPFYLQAIGSYGHSSYNFQRQLSIGSISAAQGASWSGYQYGGDLSAGAKFRFGRFSVQPSNTLSYVRLHQNGYTESGGGDFDIQVDAKNDKASLDSSRLALGYAFPAMGGTFAVVGHGAYVVQLDKDIAPLTGRFLAGGSDFTLTSAPLKGSEVQEGLSLRYTQEGLYLALSGDRRQEAGFSATSATVSLRLNF